MRALLGALGIILAINLGCVGIIYANHLYAVAEMDRKFAAEEAVFEKRREAAMDGLCESLRQWQATMAKESPDKDHILNADYLNQRCKLETLPMSSL